MLARKARVATPKRRRARSGRTARFNPQVDVAPELRRIDRIKINLTVLQAKERTIISKMNAAREETAAKLWVAPGQALRAGKKQPPVVKPRRSTRIRREDERVGVGAIGKRASQLHQELERRLARLSADAADVAEEIDRVGEHLELAVNAPLTLGDPTLSLPDEVLLVILHCLPWEMLWKGTCATVCRRWHLLLKASPTVLRRKREGRWEAYANGWLAPTVHKAHTSSVRALAIGLDGRVYSGSTDGTVRVWSGGPDPAPIQTLVGHTEGVYALAVGKDGEVYSASADLTVRVWSGGGSGKHIRTLEGHTDSVFPLAVTERRVYSGSADCTIIVWSREHGTQVGTLVGHEGHVSGLAVGEDERVYSCSSDGHIRIWAPDGRHLQLLEGHTFGVFCIAIRPTGVVVTGGRDCMLRQWAPGDGESLQELEAHASTITAVTPGVKGTDTLFTASTDVNVLMWSKAPERRDDVFSVYRDDIVFALAVGPDGTLYAGTTSGNILTF